MKQDEIERLQHLFQMMFRLDDDVDITRISPETTYRWDSFAQVQLVNAIEIEFGIEITREEAEPVGSYQDALALVREKLAAGR